MATRHLRQDGGGDYTTFKEAASKLNSGDTLIVHDGEYFTDTVRFTQNNLNIVANTGDDPYVTGRVDLPGYTGVAPSNARPSGAWQHISKLDTGANYKSYKYTSMINIQGDDCTWDNIRIERTTGRAMVIEGARCTIKNTTITENRGAAIYFWQGGDHGKIQNCVITRCNSFYLGTNVRTDGGNHDGTVAAKWATSLLIEDTRMEENSGEGVLFDINNGGSSGLTMRRCTMSDTRRDMFYIHAAANIHVESCVFYRSGNQQVSSKATIGSACMEALEYWTNNNPRWSTPRCGIDNVTWYNNLFVNLDYLMWFRWDERAGNCRNGGVRPFIRNVTVEGNTFVQNRDQAVFNVGAMTTSGIVIRGNLFYLPSPNFDAVQGTNENRMGNWTIENNAWNYRPRESVLLGNNDVINSDLKLVNPSVYIPQQGIDPDNYKVLSGSPAIGQYLNPIGQDYDGNNRVSPSTLGFHDYEATGTTPPVSPPPTPSFTMQVASQDVTEIEPDTTVDFSDTSVAGTGTIDTRSWTISIPGTSVSDTYNTQNFSHLFTNEGTYTIKLEVWQSDGQRAETVDQLVVAEVPVIPPPEPPDPPPAGDCDFTEWKNNVRSGSPTFSVEPDSALKIICDSGDQGHWRSRWAGNLQVGINLTLTFNAIANYNDGFATSVIRFYNSSGVSFLSESKQITASPTYLSNVHSVTVPSGAMVAEVDIRFWNGTGDIAAKNMCMVHAGDLAPPEATITATADGQPMSNADTVLTGTEIIFDSAGSTGDGLTYSWQKWRTDLNTPYLEPTSGTMDAYTYMEVGNYQMELTVTQSDGQQAQAVFDFNIGEQARVSFETFVVGVEKGGAEEPIEGTAPLTVEFVPTYTGNVLPSSFLWEVLDIDRNILQTILNAGKVMVTFPLAEHTDILDYGMRMTVNTQYGEKLTEEKNGIISVTFVTPETMFVGPSIPETITDTSQNAIQSDGKHTHQIILSDVTDNSSVVKSQPDGTVYMKFAEIGPTASKVTRGAALTVDKTMEFRTDAGRAPGTIFASDLTFKAARIIGALPTFDPQVPNAWWNDNGTIKISQGVELMPPESEPTGSISLMLSSGPDDAREQNNTVVIIDDEMIRFNATYPRMAYRFQNVQIPAGVTITRAEIVLRTNGQGLTLNADVGFEDIADSPAITATAANLSNRTMTQDKLTHATTVEVGLIPFSLPMAALQHIIDLPGWASGNDVTVLFDHIGGTFAVNTYEYNSTTAAVLNVEWD